jgi:predicted sugar kinase
MRSAVGTYGFVFGGLVVEQGKLPDEPISPLDCRIDLPGDWRFVLVRPRALTGLAGHDETDAFGMLPEVPVAVSEQLIAETRDRLVPAAAIGDFGLFAESLYRYGRLSGECFAARQGGPYNGPVLTALVEQIRRLGHAGVGQSSWGPTIFVAVQSQQAAEQLVDELRSGKDADELDLIISRPCNRGARIEVCGDVAELD